MTTEQIMQDFESLAEFLQDMDMITTIEGEEVGLPILAVDFLPDDDRSETTVLTYLPIPKEDVEFTKLLQLYIKIPGEYDAIPIQELIVMANQLNQLTAVGHFMVRIDDEAVKGELVIRHVLAFQEEDAPAPEVVAEVMLTMLYYCQLAEELLEQRLAGTPIEQILAQLPG